MNDLNLKYEKGISLYNAANYNDALSIFLMVEKENEGDIEGKLLLECISACYAQLGDFKTANSYTERAIGCIEDKIHKKYATAIYLFQKGEYQNSISYLDKIPRSYKNVYNEADYYFWLGRSYYFAGDNAKAQSFLKNSLSLIDIQNDEPGYAQLLYEYGSVLNDLGESNESFIIFKALDKYAHHLNMSSQDTLFYLRSYMYLNKNIYDESLKDALKSLEINELIYKNDNDEMNMKLILVARLYVLLKDYKQAIAILKRMSQPIEDFHTQWDFNYCMVIGLYHTSQYEETIPYLKKFMNLDEGRSLFTSKEYYDFLKISIDIYIRSNNRIMAQEIFRKLEGNDFLTLDDKEHIRKTLRKM